ncbi:protein phosphatase 2C domain-containing protein [Nocardioides sp. WS12]|uniref:PP2C family protein-serine/threonine phosphatase n=1 Tax=Nocardioides sp. WS12 TaxID=2486272 RepID=UPI0015FD31C5|nr:protein phosphatase 2C domain-containing protein [Nocardioides sp. WS12]
MTEPTAPDGPPPPPPPPEPTSDRPVDPDPISGPTVEGDTILPPVPADTVDVPIPAPRPALAFSYHAVSDVGRVRKDNQDSGYAGPWLLAVCDGVGGAARGDIASSTAINELRQLDEAPGSVDLIERINDGLEEAHVSIGAQVDHDASLNGTSTTVTVGLFDGARLALGHVGDSRAYLYRDGELSQLTSDHTFVQSLIDEGRITEEEARVHPHRNLILKALDGLHDVEPDLFTLELVAGDRLFFCSDGACGVLDDLRITEILADGTPEFSAVEMVRASLEAGSSDNVTCVVADVHLAPNPGDTAVVPPEPQIVGAAAELKQRRPRALFRGHRSGDTGELEPIDEEIPPGVDHAIRADPPPDPEAVRYALQPPPRFTWARRLLALAVLLGLVWVVLGTAYWWSQRQYYIGEEKGEVVLFQGVDVPGLSDVVWRPGLSFDDLSQADKSAVDGRLNYDNYEEAVKKLRQLGDETDETPTDETPTEEPSVTPPTSATTSTSTPAPTPPSGEASDFGSPADGS